MSEIRKTEIIKREKLTWAPPCAAQPAGRPSQQAAQPASLLCRLRPRQREGSVAGARARHRATPPLSLPACPPLLASVPLDDATPLPLLSLSLSPALSFLSLALSLTRPNTTVATVRRSSRLRPPLAPPTSSEAPPQLPLPPHRSTGPRKPCIAATSPFPSSGSDHRCRRIRRLQRVPEPASTPTATAVSYATVSPSPSPRSLTVASSPPRPNLRRRRARRRRSSGDHLVTPASPTRSQEPVEHP